MQLRRRTLKPGKGAYDDHPMLNSSELGLPVSSSMELKVSAVYLLSGTALSCRERELVQVTSSQTRDDESIVPVEHVRGFRIDGFAGP